MKRHNFLRRPTRLRNIGEEANASAQAWAITPPRSTKMKARDNPIPGSRGPWSLIAAIRGYSAVEKKKVSPSECAMATVPRFEKVCHFVTPGTLFLG